MCKGFTLIELLVAVLIVGILSAVAFPKYQKAVEKARAAEAFTASKSLIDAEQIYYLANGVYTHELLDLDIDFPFEKLQDRRFKGKTFFYNMWSAGDSGLFVYKNYDDGQYGFNVAFESRHIDCVANTQSTREICWSLGSSAAALLSQGINIGPGTFDYFPLY